MNRKKATCEDIEKIVKVLKEHKLKPNKEGFIALRYPIHSVNVTPAMIRKAIKILKKHIKREKPYYVEVENPVESGDPLDYKKGEI